MIEEVAGPEVEVVEEASKAVEEDIEDEGARIQREIEQMDPLTVRKYIY